MSVFLTARDSFCTAHHGLHLFTQVCELTEVIFAEVAMLVHFEVNGNLLNVRHINVRHLAWVGKLAMFVITLETFARVRDTDSCGQFLWEHSSLQHSRVLEVEHTQIFPTEVCLFHDRGLMFLSLLLNRLLWGSPLGLL